MEGSKGQPNYIRTTENVSVLYQVKLIRKWETDKKPPKWTKRGMPSFYLSFLKARQSIGDIILTTKGYVKVLERLGTINANEDFKGE